MKNKLSIQLTLFALIAALLSCTDDGIGQFDEVVIENEDNMHKFRQLTFLVSLEDENYGYINTDRIDSLDLFVNAKYWGTFSSESSDTSNRTDRVVNNIKYSDDPVVYLFVAPYQLKTDDLSTAGDFVDYLKDRLTLTPGDYICEIKRLGFKNSVGETIKIPTRKFADFKVLENMSSSYVGNFNLQIGSL